MKKGKFYGIGVGVGDPENITVKATKRLHEVDVIVLPEARSGEGSTAFNIVKEYVKPDVEQLFLEFPMIKDVEARKVFRKNNAGKINVELEKGKKVAFLTIGDPMTYSTYTYVLEHISDDVEVETIAGITSFNSIAARLNIPLMIGDEDLKVISVNRKTDIYKEIENNQNLVLMKISRDFEKIKKAIIETGNKENVVIVSDCGKDNEVVYWDIESVEEVPYFSTMILKKKGVEEISRNTLRKIELSKFIIPQILFFAFYFLVGKYDWDYGFDLPFRLFFGGMFSIITGIIFGVMFYFMGKKSKYENDKILKLPIFFIILSVILLFRIDIIGVIKLCFFNGLFILGIFRSKIKIRSYLSKVSKIILWFVTMYFLIPSFAICFGVQIFTIPMESYEDRMQFSILIPFVIINICFGFFIKKYFDKEEMKIIRKLTILGCLIIAFIFIFIGFNWYKEDYYAIIYTFPYKVLMYFKETQISIEKIGIIKTLESRYFVYAMVVNMGFYLGTLKMNNKNKRRNCVENQIDGDI